MMGVHGEIDYDQGEQQAYVDHNVSLLTANQQNMYNCFCMIDKNEGGMVFLDALGGTGMYDISNSNKNMIRM